MVFYKLVIGVCGRIFLFELALFYYVFSEVTKLVKLFAYSVCLCDNSPVIL